MRAAGCSERQAAAASNGGGQQQQATLPSRPNTSCHRCKHGHCCSTESAQHANMPGLHCVVLNPPATAPNCHTPCCLARPPGLAECNNRYHRRRTDVAGRNRQGDTVARVAWTGRWSQDQCLNRRMFEPRATTHSGSMWHGRNRLGSPNKGCTDRGCGRETNFKVHAGTKMWWTATFLDSVVRDVTAPHP